MTGPICFALMNTQYCPDFLNYQRRFTSEVNIGGIPMGGKNPVRIQSMTNTPTHDIVATADQIIRMYEAGADYVRLTVPSLKDAENLGTITQILKEKHCPVPLIADVHFNPEIAIIAAGKVQKVRINPGNYSGKKEFRIVDYSEKQYREELNELKKKFVRLLEECKKHRTALRIGVNHGSLSDRIMSRYGDTPEGMAESAMEFLRICHEEDFNDVVISMKASNTRTMVYATRLVVRKMLEEHMHYPLHLGVTEAGEGEDGRIRSAIGIGALLVDGIGDTIRVSLTEDPVAEIPVAKKIISRFLQLNNHVKIPGFGNYPLNPFLFQKRQTYSAGCIGGNFPPVIISAIEGEINENSIAAAGWSYSNENGWKFDTISADVLYLPTWPDDLPVPEGKYIITHSCAGNPESKFFIPLMNWQEFIDSSPQSSALICLQVSASQLDEEKISRIKESTSLVIMLETDHINGFADQRAAIFRLINNNCHSPVILKRSYCEKDTEDFQIRAACDLGGLLIDGLGEGIWLENKGNISIQTIISTGLSILQFSRVRISRTEYISCPSCGRTLFDLQTTTKKIREKTAHLKGLKIGIMGCIVNGPGEMADADYGYVGTGKGKVTLYKEKTVIKRNVPEKDAVDELIELIKENGDWVEP